MQYQKMFALSLMLLSCSLLFSNASYVDNISKCSIKDNQCIIDGFEKMLRGVGSTGIAEFNMFPVDPMQLKNISVTVLDAITLTITDGAIKGLKNCHVKRFSLDLDKELGSQDLACDVLTIKGQFLFGGSSPTIQNLFQSNSTSGHGKVKIELEKVTMTLDIPVSLIKKEDGDIYLNLSRDNVKYSYNIEHAKFHFKNLVMGNNDISQVVTSYVNSEWRTLIKPFGKIFIDKIMDLLMIFGKNFYDNVPTKVFLKEDLTPYIKH